KSTPGLYDTKQSAKPQKAFPYNDTRDGGQTPGLDGGGYPTCLEWWTNGGNGLRGRIADQVQPSLWNRIKSFGNFMSDTDVEDAVIRTVVSAGSPGVSVKFTDYGGAIESRFGDGAARLGSGLGMGVGEMFNASKVDAMRVTLPMVQSFLKLAVVICIPMLLVIGSYELKHVVTVSIVIFALFFVDFWFQFARWVDSTIFDALYGSGYFTGPGESHPYTDFDPLLGTCDMYGANGASDCAYKHTPLEFVMGSLFTVLPTLWVAAWI
ncbi:MAG: conjugal transfer protein TraG N-terminal domain-containing protein, partial [Pseudomonadales bacterium]|nr:conjugal transfer protein TraG N-terminal domain-containing protein [Pseudomonadales bacterium]